MRWLRRAKPDPLTRVGLGGRRDKPATKTPPGAVQAVRRTAITANPLAVARLDEAMRALARETGDGLPETARRRVESVVDGTRPGLPAALDEAAAGTDLHVSPPLWWRLVGLLQWVAAAALVVGLLWVLALWLLTWFTFPAPPKVEWRGWPLQSLLIAGGALVGVVMAAIGRRVTAVGARRRARAARRSLADQVAQVVDRQVLTPVNAELTALTELRRAVRKV